MTTPVSYVEICTEFTESACTETAWVPYVSGVVPSLSIADAEQIGAAIALLWAGAWVIRMLKKVLNES